jgi:hypothetical protein
MNITESHLTLFVSLLKRGERCGCRNTFHGKKYKGLCIVWQYRPDLFLWSFSSVSFLVFYDFCRVAQLQTRIIVWWMSCGGPAGGDFFLTVFSATMYHSLLIFGPILWESISGLSHINFLFTDLVKFCH